MRNHSNGGYQQILNKIWRIWLECAGRPTDIS